jgi:lysophospholipase L1-like esterase
MSLQRSVLVAAVVALLAGAGCSSTQTIASSEGDGDGADAAVETAPPTIGLGSEIDLGAGVAPADVSSDAAARAVDPDAIETLVMIGDSITVGSQAALEERLGEVGFPDAVIEAQNGKRIAQDDVDNPSGVAIADQLTLSGVADDPAHELWVVALGTNDIGQYADAAEVGAVVDEMLAAVPAESALVWVDTYLPNDPEGSQLVDDVVRERLDRRGNAVVAEWSAVADREGVLSSDMIHPSDQGTQVFASTVAATVDRFVNG